MATNYFFVQFFDKIQKIKSEYFEAIIFFSEKNHQILTF